MDKNITNELTSEYINILKSVSTNTSEAKEFILNQAPDVVQQTLIWYGTYSAVVTAIGILLIIATAYINIKYTGRGKIIEGKKIYGKQQYKWTLTHDSNGDLSPQFLITGFLSIIGIAYCISLMSLTWLQIWIAPKLYLIEKAAELIKG